MDDALVILAYIMLLASAGLWQMSLEYIYTLSSVGAGEGQPPRPKLCTATQQRVRGMLATGLLYCISVWSIKLAFLLFFRRVGRDVRGQAVLWWSVLGFNVVSFVAWLGIAAWQITILTTATARGELSDSNHRAETSHQCLQYTDKCYNPSEINSGYAPLKVQTALDVISDAASKPHSPYPALGILTTNQSILLAQVIVIPFCLLWKVQIPLRRKLALSGIFSLSIFIMVASVSRVVIVTLNGGLYQSWIIPGSAIEMATGIAKLPS